MPRKGKYSKRGMRKARETQDHGPGTIINLTDPTLHPDVGKAKPDATRARDARMPTAMPNLGGPMKAIRGKWKDPSKPRIHLGRPKKQTWY